MKRLKVIKRVKALNFIVEQAIKGNILEVGCGPAPFLLDRVAVAADLLPFKWEKFVRCDAHSLPFKNEVFDAVVAVELIEHLQSPPKFVKEAYRVLAEDGILIIATPNRYSWLLRLVTKEDRITLNLIGKLYRRFFKKLWYCDYTSHDRYEHHKQIFDMDSLVNLCKGYFNIRHLFTGWYRSNIPIFKVLKQPLHILSPIVLSERLILIAEKATANVIMIVIAILIAQSSSLFPNIIQAG